MRRRYPGITIASTVVDRMIVMLVHMVISKDNRRIKDISQESKKISNTDKLLVIMAVLNMVKMARMRGIIRITMRVMTMTILISMR